MAKQYTIRDVGDGELHCRDLGHHWDDGYTKHGMRPPLFGTRHTAICGHCSSMRHDVINISGKVDLSSRRYDYTVEYHFACEFERIECRVERHRRAESAVSTRKRKVA